MTSEEYIDRNAPRWYVVLLRLFAGYYFLHVGMVRLLTWWNSNSGQFLRDKLDKLTGAEGVKQLSWFESYLNTVIAPIKDSDVFVYLLLAAPLLLGLALVLGLFSRLSTLLGVLLVLNVYFVKFNAGDLYQRMFLEMQLAVLVVLFFAAAGRTFGLDGVFWRGRVQRKLGGAPQKAPARAGAPRPAAAAVPRRPLKVEETVGHFAPLAGPQVPKPTPKPPAPPEPKKPEEPPGKSLLELVEEEEKPPQPGTTKASTSPLPEGEDIFVEDIEDSSDKKT